MLIDWFKLIAALILLLTPIGLFHGKKVRYRPIAHDWQRHWPRVLGLGLHLIDFLRAALGAWLLSEALTREPGAQGMLRFADALTQGGVLMVATILQAVVCKERDAAHAPFAFVAGLVLGFLPPAIALFGLLLAIAITAGSRRPAAFFPLLAVSVAAMGFLFTRQKLLLQLVAVACAVTLPWLLTLLFPQELVLSYVTKRAPEAVPATGEKK
jgi:hypothetical protein